MVNATVDNSPVSISLINGETTTVPTGETWKVTMTMGSSQGISSKASLHIKLNSDIIMTEIRDDGGGGYNMSAQTFETVVTAGDTIKMSGDSTDDGMHIGGFVVN
jgi:hypothetical protein